jgi:type I restriction enzyme R subunit
LCLYQAVTGTAEDQNIYKQFSPDFFDLVIVDECHRGSAADDAAWRQVLEYFSSATQIGLTATPKETKDVSNIEYFGEPIYTYSLKQGIADGFLAPYKVVRIGLDKDLDGWRPSSGQTEMSVDNSCRASCSRAWKSIQYHTSSQNHRLFKRLRQNG